MSDDDRGIEIEGRVWTTFDKEHFYYVPLEVELPEGATPVKCGNDRRMVDLDQLSEYEVSREEAAAWMNKVIGAGMGRLNESLSRLTGREDSNLSFESLLGMSPGDAYTDPEKTSEAFDNVVKWASKALGPALAEAFDVSTEGGKPSSPGKQAVDQTQAISDAVRKVMETMQQRSAGRPRPRKGADALRKVAEALARASETPSPPAQDRPNREEPEDE